MNLRQFHQRQIAFQDLIYNTDRWTEVFPDWAEEIVFDRHGNCIAYENSADPEGEEKDYPQFSGLFENRVFVKSKLNK